MIQIKILQFMLMTENKVLRDSHKNFLEFFSPVEFLIRICGVEN